MKLLRHQSAAHGRRGTLLVWTAFATMAIFAACMVSVSVAKSTSQVAQTKQNRSQAERIAVSAAMAAEEALRAAVAGALPPPAQGQLVLAAGVGNWTATPLGPGTWAMDGSGLSGFEQTFAIEAFGEHRGVTARERRMVVGRRVPIFQFALVHEHDLTFFNPAPLRINGPVHTNGNLNILSRMSLELDTNHVRVAGRLQLRAPWDEWYGGNQAWWEARSVDPSVRRWVQDPLDPLEPREFGALSTKQSLAKLGASSSSGLDSDFAGFDSNGDGDFDDLLDVPPYAAAVLARFGPPEGYKGGHGHTLLSTEHGDNRVLLPPLESFDLYVPGDELVFDPEKGDYVPAEPGKGTHSVGPYRKAADLVIHSHPDGTFVAFNGQGEDITEKVAGAVKVSTLYDARQASGSKQSIQNTIIDLEALAGLGWFPKNGLLYASGFGSGTGTDVKGFQLTKGSKLPGPLTVVSPDSVYIHGDFNTESPRPAAVMADAIGLLSNAWDGSKVPGKLPLAKSTTYNAALVLGDSKPGPDNMNGGAVNLARYHEDWRGQTAAIHGSIVCTGWSRKATGQFVLGGDHYFAPNRNWSFDQNFTDPTLLPPFTPAYASLRQAAIW